jgi:gelsolin
MADEGGSGAGVFLSEFGEGTTLQEPKPSEALPDVQPILLRLSDSTGAIAFDVVEPPTRSSLHSSDAFLLDHSSNAIRPAIYVWLGKDASLNERRLVVQYAQRYLYNKLEKGGSGRVQVAIPVVRMNEGDESEDFLRAIGE